MDFNEYCQVVSEITHVTKEVLKEEAIFRDDLGIDSLQMVNFLVELSEKTGVSIDVFTYTDDIKTIGGVYRTLVKALQK